MDVLIYIACVVLIVMNLLILAKSIKNYNRLNKKFLDSQAKYCLFNLKNGILKEKTFFHMKNGGLNPCESTKNIEYMDYIGKSNLFVEKKI